MARRELSEINAGSMADIAFLLLVFFLVVTTMNTDSGMKRLLPPPLPPDFEAPDVIQRNVYEVLVNFKNDLLVEGAPMRVQDLKEGAKEFLLANGDNVLRSLQSPIDGLPIRTVKGSLDSVRTVIKSYESEIKLLNKELEAINDPNKIKPQEDKIKSVEKKRDGALAKQYAFEFFGKFASLPTSALISVQNDNSTNYETYVAVNNELEAAVRELRDELAMQKFNVTFSQLDNEDEDDKKKILAIRQVYPQRISEAEPIDVKGFTN